MSAPARRPVVPKLGNSFLTRQLSLQSPTPPIQQPLQQHHQQLTHQHRKLAFRRQSSEDLSFRRSRRRGRDTPSPAPSLERDKCRNPAPTPPRGASDEKRANTISDRSTDVRWSGGGKQDPPPVPASPLLFNRHFPQSKEHSPCPPAASFTAGVVGGGGPVAGRPITPARPRPVRLAWAEKRSATVQPAPSPSDPQHPPEDPAEDDAPVEVVAKKMGQPKPVTGSVLKAQLVRSQHSLPSMTAEDTVLQTRQQLADKLRKAWWGEDQLRPNLDIFLTCLANDANGAEGTPPGQELTKEGAHRKSQKDNGKGSGETDTEKRESKMISIKIDTMASENSSREGDNDDPMSSSEPKVSLVSGSLSKGANGRPGQPHAPHESPSLSKSTSSLSPFSSKDHADALTSSNEPKASSNPSAGHAAGNGFVCAVEICEKPKDTIPCEQGHGGCLLETLPPREPVSTLQTSDPSFPSGFADATPAGQVTNGFASQAGKGSSETKREVTSASASKAPAPSGQGNEGKASGGGNASLRRAQFRNSSMNRRTLARSADSNPPPSGPAAPGPPVSSGNAAAEAFGRARDEAAKARRGPVQEGAAERNPWRRNAESTGITRASTVDGGESSQPAESGPWPVQARPSTAAARPAAALRSAPSLAAAAKHRQKTPSKRRPVRRSTEDDEGAEGEGAGEDAGGVGGVRGPGGYPRGKGGVRGAHADVVTMVSLVSPTGSDTEDPLPQVFSFPRDPAATAPAVPTPVAVSSRAQSARRSGEVLSRMLSMDVGPERSATQRKLHKSVSFQSDLLPDDEEDVFSRRPAFPASLIIPRIPTSAPTAPTPPLPASSPSAPAAAPPKVPSSAPVIIPPSLSQQQHVPKIVDPGTPRSSYSPPSPPPSRAAGHGPAGGSERPSTAAAGTPAAGAAVAPAPGHVAEEDGVAAEEAASPGEKGRPSRKRVMFRSRSASLRGSEEDHGEAAKERTGTRGAQSSHGAHGSPSVGGARADGTAATDKSSHASASDAAKQRGGLGVTLTERQSAASSRAAEDRARGGARVAGGSSGGAQRPSTAGGGNRGSHHPAEKGKKDADEADEEEEGEETGMQVPEFKSAKEKECWELYRRMCDKGLTVSYDTILRGMLTPTEYRMRRNALLSIC